MIINLDDKKEALRELDFLRNEMLEHLGQMKELIRSIAGREDRGMCLERARAYWLMSVENNLSAESGSFLGSMVNFESTLTDLREVIDSETNHPDDCDCVECTERREPGGLMHDPSNTDDEAERHLEDCEEE